MAWTRTTLLQRLSVLDRESVAWAKKLLDLGPEGHQAAVLVPLVLKQGVPNVWLTLRSGNLRRFSGHVSFPGGKQDPTDKDLEHTALREAHEEIGLDPQLVEPVAQMIPRVMMEGTVITPIVGFVPESFTPVVNPSEVVSAFLVPLERYLSGKGHTPKPFSDRGLTFLFPHFHDVIDGEKYHTWGLTALVCMQLAITVFQRPPDFEWDRSGLDSVEDPYRLQMEYLQRRVKEKQEKQMATSKSKI